MSFKDLYGHSEYKSNLAHFAAMSTLAASDGSISDEEKALLDKFALKLNISERDYEMVMDPAKKFPIEPPVSSDKRLERLYDLFRIIFVDHQIDEEEMALIRKYAIGLGYASEQAEAIIARSILIFSGKIGFEDYQYLLER